MGEEQLGLYKQQGAMEGFEQGSDIISNCYRAFAYQPHEQDRSEETRAGGRGNVGKCVQESNKMGLIPWEEHLSLCGWKVGQRFRSYCGT